MLVYSEGKTKSGNQTGGIRMLRRGMAGLGWGMLFLAVFGGVMTVIGAGRWYMEIAAYAVPLFVALSVAACLCALLARRWAQLQAALAVLIMAVLLLRSGTGQALRAIPPDAVPLRVFSANLWTYNHDPAPVLDLIKRLDPDIVLFQEYDAAWHERLKPLAATYPQHHASPRYTNGGLDLGQFWRVPSGKPQLLASAGLPAVHTRLEIAGQHVDLLNVHTAAAFSPRRAESHRNQMLAIADWCCVREGNIIAVGDFNSTPWSPLFQALLSRAKLKDSRHGFGILGSWPTFLAPVATPRDHLLTKGEIAVQQFRRAPHIGSDHYPLLIDLAILPAQTR